MTTGSGSVGLETRPTCSQMCRHRATDTDCLLHKNHTQVLSTFTVWVGGGVWYWL